MYYFVASLLVALIGVVPLLLRLRFVAATLTAVVSFIVVWGIAYWACPTTVWPMFGYFGFMGIIVLAASAGINSAEDEEATWTWAFPALAFVLFLGSFVPGCGALNADAYARMIGPMEEKVWTQTIQPKDPRHMRMANRENAIYQAQKVLGSLGAIGSQYNISEDHMTLQMVNGKLWFIVPLDYTGFTVWNSYRGVPGYIKVDGEDPHTQPIPVILPDGQKMVYTPGAYFGDNLERYLRNSGYLNYILTDWTFEVDEQGKVWWVVTVAKPTIWWDGEKVQGVVLLDPVTGDQKFYPIGSIPDWVDRAIPASYVKSYLTWQGEYTNGWMNSWWGKKGLTEPEEPRLIYGTGDQPEFVTGITSSSGKDNSLIALIYTNSRTGKSVKYVMKGGATDSAVIDAIDKNSQVQLKKMHAVDPQLYNVDGIPVAVAPLLNESHAYQGVAMVPINDVQTVGVGANQYEALRDLEGKISEGGQRMAIDQARDIQSIQGVVDRFASELVSNGTIYYIHIKGVAHLFTAKAGENAKLPVTNIGDTVRLEFYDSTRDVVPTKSFDNLSVPLSTSPVQQAVTTAVNERRDSREAKDDAATAMEELKKLPPEELLKRLGKKK